MSAQAHRDETAIEKGRCRNCGASLSARYCGECGQRELDQNERQFSHLVRDFLGAAFYLDSQFWRSFIARKSPAERSAGPVHAARHQSIDW